MKSAILFVDDNENILQGLRRNLRSMHQEWDLHFATSGTEALRILQEKNVDVIVSDMRMPGMDGADFLKRAKAAYGHTFRIVLSGQCDEESLLTLLEVSHQYVAKPCETAALIAVIKPVLEARAALRDEGLKKYITGLSALPTLPSLHKAITSELQESLSPQTVENFLLRDVSLVAKIFQVMNSSYFGTTQDINTVAYVWETLGLEKIRNLILNGHIMAPLDASLENDVFMTDLWALNLMTARIARLIAKAENMPQKICDKVWIAGLLHAIGAVILHEYGRKSGGGDTGDTLAADRAADAYPLVGSFLALLWGLPRDIGYVIRHHAAPDKAGNEGDKTVLAIIHTARAFAHGRKDAVLEASMLNEAFLRQMNVWDKLESWRLTAATI